MVLERDGRPRIDVTWSLGVDPGLHRVAWALVTDTEGQGRIEEVGIVRSDGETAERAVVAMIKALDGANVPSSFTAVVEGQEIYKGMTKNPMDILHLAQVAGAVAGRLNPEGLRMPLPKEWKGTTPKDVHQLWVLEAYGIAGERVSAKDGARPLPGAMEARGSHTIKSNEWSHVIDAIGLARWGIKGRSMAYEGAVPRSMVGVRRLR